MARSMIRLSPKLPSLLVFFLLRSILNSSVCGGEHWRRPEGKEKVGMGPQQDRSAPAKAYGNGGAAVARARRKESKAAAVRYRECQRNHAAAIGGYAVDGCREFMAAGADGTAAALLCAACGCHRSFHRREDAADCDCSSDTSGDRR